jgi:hypothetical protein
MIFGPRGYSSRDPSRRWSGLLHQRFMEFAGPLVELPCPPRTLSTTLCGGQHSLTSSLDPVLHSLQGSWFSFSVVHG